MKDLGPQGKITYRAIQQSRPGIFSWLALLVFIGSLLLALSIRDSIVEQARLREICRDAPCLATLDSIILGVSTGLAVGASIIAWRVWWTFSLIGTTALGMPDLAAIGADNLRSGASWSARNGVILSRQWLLALGRAAGALIRFLSPTVTFCVFFSLRAVTSTGNYLWLALATSVIYLRKGTVWSFRTLSSGICWLWMVLGRGWSAVAGPAGAAAAAVLGFLGKSVSLGSKYLWLAVSIPVIYLGKGTAWSFRSLWAGVGWLWMVLGRGWSVVIGPLGPAVVGLFRFLRDFLADGAYLLLRQLSKMGAALGKAMATVSVVFSQNLVSGLRNTGRYLQVATYAMGRDLKAALALIGRASRLAASAGFRYIRTGLTFTRAGLTFTALNLPVAIGILLFSPVVPLRLAVDKTFRQDMAARCAGLWTFLMVRPAIGLMGLGVVLALGVSTFFAYESVWPSESPVEVLIWTSDEKQNVLQPVLDRFNQGGAKVTVSGRRYQVQAYSVPVDSAEMHAYLVAKLNRGIDFPEGTGGAPTVVSPSTSGWLDLVNLDTGQQVFPNWLRPIVRTPVVIVTYQGMARCLGWPGPVGWADIIAITENPQGWSSCPTAQPEWGKKPLLVVADPALSSTGRSTLHILDAIAAADIDDPKLRDLFGRFQSIVDHSYSDTSELQKKMRQGPNLVHFAPVEEYYIPRFYQSQQSTDSTYEAVAIYPSDGTVWHDNPFAVPDGSWVTVVQREAAHLVEEYLRSKEVQAEFMESGFRPGIYVDQRDLLTPSQGLDLKQPQVVLRRVSAEVARSIQRRWKGGGQ